MANCLVTKLKGTVDNPNLPYYGQLTLKLHDTNIPSQQNLYILYTAGYNTHINYIATGLTTLSNSQGGAQIPMQGTVNPGTQLFWTGNGEIKLWSKYNMPGISVNSRAEFKNIEELYYLNDDFKLQSYSYFTVVDSIDKDIYFNNGEQRLPAVKNLDYSKVHVTPGVDVYMYLFKIDPVTGFQIHNGLGISGDMNNILGVQGMTLQNLKAFEAYEDGLYFSNINVFNGAGWSRLDIHGSVMNGDVIAAFSSWTNLTFFTYEKSLNVEWKPVLDAWKTAGVVSRTIQCICNGTIDGVNINGGFNVTYDASGNWTYVRCES